MIVPTGLLVLALVLIMAEVLVPSMGLLSVLAVASLVGSIASAFQHDSDVGITFVIVASFVVPLAIVGSMKLVPKSPLGKKLIISGLSFDSAHATDQRDAALLGRTGLVEAALRPAGMARIDGRRVDVVSLGESIPVGTLVQVVEVRGNRVVVAPKQDAGAPEPPATVAHPRSPEPPPLP